MKRATSVLAFLALLILMACGGGGGHGTSAVNVGGTWTGDFVVQYDGDATLYTNSGTVSISQNGNSISGAITFSGVSGAYSFSGSVSGSDFSMDYQDNDCGDHGHVSGSVNGNAMNFSGTGNTGNCYAANGFPPGTSYSVWGQLTR
jgi:hypothetical protein